MSTHELGQEAGSCVVSGCQCHGQPGHGQPTGGDETVAQPPVAPARLSRRRLFGATLGGTAAALLAGVGAELAAPKTALAQSTLTPDAALKTLMDGNQRFIEQGMTSFQEDLTLLKQHTAEKQEPFASVLSCADSRVPVELVFDQTIGHVFVNRVAGNVVTAEIIASIEYGVAVLGTKVIMVLGHGNCGAIKATIANKAVPGQISSLYRLMRPAVNEAGDNVDAVIAANAKIQAQLLRESSTVVTQALKDGTVQVVAAVYALDTGKVTLLG